MSPRYSNSVKIGKGVKVNFGKTGPSLTMKGAGVSVNLSSKGVKVNTGSSGRKKPATPPPPPAYGRPSVPPPSYGHSASYGSSSYGRSGSGRSSSKTYGIDFPIAFTVKMDERGQSWVVDDHGREITDPTILRKIKADPAYKQQKAELDYQRQSDIAALVEASAEENEKFLNIYKYAPIVETEKDFRKELDSLRVEYYVREAFQVPEPTPGSIRLKLESEAVEKVTGFFMVNRKREEYVTLNMPTRVAEAKQAWLEQKYAFEAEQDKKEQEVNAEAEQLYESKKAYLNLMMQGDSELLLEALDDWIGDCQLPVEIDISYKWDEESGSMYLDVDLPEIGVLPQTEITQASNGNAKEKAKTQKQLRDEYATVVFGLAIFITSNVFNISPAIRRILLSGYTQRRDKIGNNVDEYIYSIKFPRELFEKQDFTKTDPMNICMHAENRCNTTSTLLFKAIEPYDAY